VFFLLKKTEKRGFHPVGEYHIEYRKQGKQNGH